jgi:5-(carboxyamino)imidazole ribonucleotide mutase
MDNKRFSVGVIMGSDSDLPVMRGAASILEEFGVEAETTIVSAHRTPDRLVEYAKGAATRGLKVIIAGAGGAAHLPGMVASFTSLPVIGVPIMTKSVEGLDSLLSIAQMPPGVPVAAVAVNGAKNAGLLAVEILALADKELQNKLIAYKEKMKHEVEKKIEELKKFGIQKYLEEIKK